MPKPTFKKLLLLIVLVLTIFAPAEMEFLSKMLAVNQEQNVDKKTGVQGTLDKLYKVVRVIDGDTIKVESKGEESTVRLIGIDAPEIGNSSKKRECFSEEAKQFLKQYIEEKYVRLEADPTQQNYDRYGRLLRFVFTEDQTNVNLLLIQEGFAHEYRYSAAYEFSEQFKNAEQEARLKERGLWAFDAC